MNFYTNYNDLSQFQRIMKKILQSADIAPTEMISTYMTDILFIKQLINPSDHITAKNTWNISRWFARQFLASLFGFFEAMAFTEQDREAVSFYYRYDVLRFDHEGRVTVWLFKKQRRERRRAVDAGGLPAVFINQESPLCIRQPP